MCVRFLLCFSLALFVHYGSLIAAADVHPKQGRVGADSWSDSSSAYVLGVNDSLSIHILDADEVGTQPYVIDLRGDIELPRIGRIHAAGLTITELEVALISAYRAYLRKPIVTVSIAEYHSQPVSILGEVTSPGVFQIRGHSLLLELISQAGGLRSGAGSRINIARQKSYGPIPVSNNTLDAENQLYRAHIDIHSLMEGRSCDENLALLPHDVVTVPRADLVYVFGAVRRPGGFALSEKSSISVLQALTLAEGLDVAAATKSSKILRFSAGLSSRSETPIDIKGLIAGRKPDIALFADDILFIPKSAMKMASIRTIDAVVQAGTGFAIYRPF